MYTAIGKEKSQKPWILSRLFVVLLMLLSIQIFKDLAVMVHEQGEMIDSIEANVDSAVVHVDQGATNVQRAAQYQSKVRRKRFFCVIFLIVLIIVVALIIYFSTRSSSK